SELDARIFALEESLAAVRCEREKLQSRLDDYKCPILTLPFEITSDIFIDSLPQYPERPPMIGLLSPALLGQVCQQWRDVAFGTPQLWRAIEIVLRLDIPHLFSEGLNVLNTWLDRSTNYPVSLCIQSRGYPLHEAWPFQLHGLTDTIFTHSDRLEYLKLIMRYRELHWGGIRVSFLLLRDLTFGPRDTHELQSAATAFCDSPSLTSVHFSINSKPSHVKLPWSQLTTISVAVCDTADAAHILRHAVSVVEFRGTLWGDNERPEQIPPLMHLKTLTLDDELNNHPGTQMLLLDALTTPALQHLTISERELGVDHLATITFALSRSKCYLDSLRV
ncbi:hypothetical protein C8J57DRAFT_1008320, partial [Mycena rebaudengoi]